jgi:hypothetical protein
MCPGRSFFRDKVRDPVHVLCVNHGQERFFASALQNTLEAQVISYFAETLSINATQLL